MEQDFSKQTGNQRCTCRQASVAWEQPPHFSVPRMEAACCPWAHWFPLHKASPVCAWQPELPLPLFYDIRTGPHRPALSPLFQAREALQSFYGSSASVSFFRWFLSIFPLPRHAFLLAWRYSPENSFVKRSGMPGTIDWEIFSFTLKEQVVQPCNPGRQLLDTFLQILDLFRLVFIDGRQWSNRGIQPFYRLE